MKKNVLISLLIMCCVLSKAFIASAASSSEGEPVLTGSIFQRMNDALKRIGTPEKNTNIKQESLFEQTEESIKGYTKRLTESPDAKPNKSE